MGKATKDQYREMRRLCRQVTNVYLSDEEAVKMAKRIHKNLTQKMAAKNRRLTLKPPTIVFRGKRQSGSSWGGEIRISHDPSVYLLIHELAHEYHGHIYPIVGKKENKGTPNHHGPDYLAHLLFIKEMVLKKKVYKKWLAPQEQAQEKKQMKNMTKAMYNKLVPGLQMFGYSMEAYAVVEEDLTSAEATTIQAFLEWVIKKRITIGKGNVAERIAEFKKYIESK